MSEEDDMVSTKDSSLWPSQKQSLNNPSSILKSLQLREGEVPGPAEIQH